MTKVGILLVSHSKIWLGIIDLVSEVAKIFPSPTVAD